jgi:signal transduction histidine kinase
MNEVAELARVREKLATIPGSGVMLEALFALAPVGFQLYDVSGRSLLVNQAFRDLFASEPPPEYNVRRDEIAAANGMLDLVQRAFAGEVVSTPPIWYDPRELTQVKVTEGRRVAIATTLFPLRNDAGAVTHVGIVIKDVTADMEKRAQEEAARRDAEFLSRCSEVLAGSLDVDTTLSSLARIAIPHLADFCVIDVVDDDGSYRRVASAHVDPSKEAIVGELQRLYPPTPESPTPAAVALRTGRPELVFEVDEAAMAARAVDDGHRALLRELSVRSHLVVPLVARERVIASIGLVFAESGRHYGASELRLATDLASRAALALDNARLYREAHDAIRVRDDFLSVAGHELRTPLTAARLSLELVSRAAQRAAGHDATDATDGGPLGRKVADLDRQIRRLGVLVDELLDVSRLRAGRIALYPEEVDLAALGREVVARVLDEGARAGTPISIRAPAPVVGRWDRARLDQVLSNLLSNAVKYGAGKPVQVDVGVDGDGDGAQAILVVRDNGIGIAPENATRIFRKFERAVPEQHFGGLGLGLWICRELVEAMSGHIEVESAPGRGATFTVRLARAAI